MPTPVKLQALIGQIEIHHPGIRSFTLELARKAPRFRPGQFVQLAIDRWSPSEHWPESRAFSIASSPLQRDRLRLTVSKKGRFTSRMFEELEVGSTVWLKMPFGEFSPQPLTDGTVVLVAGGTGITPFVSFLEWYAEQATDCPVHLHYGARAPELLIYRQALESFRRRQPAIEAHYYAERATDPDEIPSGVKAGRILADAIWQALPGGRPSQFYLSGPKAMIETLGGELLGLGAAPETLTTDEWS